MSNLMLFGLLIMLLLVVQLNASRTVEEVIERYNREIGGNRMLASLSRIYMEGVRIKGGTRSDFIVMKEQDLFCRKEIVNGDMESFTLVTKNGAWADYSGSQAGPVSIDGEMLLALQQDLDIPGALVNFEVKGYTASLLEKETLEGISCYKIMLRTQEGKETIFWVETGTWLLNQRLDYADGANAGVLITLYKDYKEVDGLMFPHCIEKKAVGIKESGMEEVYLYSRILVNPDLPAGAGDPVFRHQVKPG